MSENRPIFVPRMFTVDLAGFWLYAGSMAQPTTTPLSLPAITLVMIDSETGELADKALVDTLQVISPGDLIEVRDGVDSLEDYNRILWYEIPPRIKTSHILVIQWDGWVVSPQAWKDEFLDYDYIGAVWPWHPYLRVGNGGFSLRSKKLLDHLAENRDRYPPGQIEDDSLCRRYREFIETETDGNPDREPIIWAPEQIARQFSHEHPLTRRSVMPFGFHDIRNWPWTLNREQLAERMYLCEKSRYINQKREYLELKAELRLGGRDQFSLPFQPFAPTLEMKTEMTQ